MSKKIYTKVINEETKECLIINQVQAKQQGLEEIEVEFGYDGKCYLKGYTPQKPFEELKQEKIQELKQVRDEYKKTILIKDDVSLYELETYKNDYFNMINLRFGWIEKDKLLYEEELSKIVNKYNNFKDMIKKAENKEELEKIEIKFEEKKIDYSSSSSKS